MSEPHTLESFEALPDDAARNAAMARAVGWEYRGITQGCRRHWRRWTGYGWQHDYGPRVRHYTAGDGGGDGDPFANWGLLAEVWRLLRTAPDATWHLEDWEQLGWLMDALAVGEGEMPPNYAGSWGHAATPHRAACLAAVAAGLVPKETDDE